MREETYERNGVRYIRITKNKARKYFDMGKVIGLLPVNANPDSLFWQPTHITKRTDYEKFDTYVNAYKHYNCTSYETGFYVKFFVEG